MNKYILLKLTNTIKRANFEVIDEENQTIHGNIMQIWVTDFYND